MGRARRLPPARALRGRPRKCGGRRSGYPSRSMLRLYYPSRNKTLKHLPNKIATPHASMLNFTQARLTRLVLHRVGNRNREEGTRSGKSEIALSEDLRLTLQNYFLGSLQTERFYQFAHDVQLDMNEAYAYCSYIFEEPKEAFYPQSLNLMRHLYEQSTHTKIQAGELYVAYFEDCVLEDELVDAIGIFKVETKSQFLQLRAQELQAEDGSECAEYSLQCLEGTHLGSLDKGALILRTQQEEGFRIAAVDTKGAEAKYWLEDFLHALPLVDDAYRTRAYLDLCKDFSKKVLAKSDDKTAQVNFVNRSIDYFEQQEEFDERKFVDTVFQGAEEWREDFTEHKEKYQARNPLPAIRYNDDDEGFEDLHFFIAPQAVKSAKKSFKNSIQLDTQMEIKIQSSQAQESGCIERGYDEERGMFFYKLFFREEK